MHRKMKDELTAEADRGAPRLDGALMQFDNPPDERQSDAHAPFSALKPAGALREQPALGNTRLRSFSNARFTLSAE